MSIDESKIEPEKESCTDQAEKPNDQLDNNKSNNDPSNIPRKGYFFEHDTRQDNNGSTDKRKNRKKNFNKKERTNLDEKWVHDRFDERQQQPKSKCELVKRYGYDIRQEKNIESIGYLKTNISEAKNEQASEDETESRRIDLNIDSDEEIIGKKLADLRRRKNIPNKINQSERKNFKPRTNVNQRLEAKSFVNDNLENSFQKMALKPSHNSNQNAELPKRYSTIRNQSNYNTHSHQTVQPTQMQQTYQPSYQNWQPNFHQNFVAQTAPPPGLSLPQSHNNNQYYYIQQSDYVAAQEYAAAMAATLMSNPVFYSNGNNTASPSSISPLNAAQSYQANRQSKAIPIVNPNKSNK